MVKTIYFVRHAPTKANLSGEMLEDYNKFGILPFDIKGWWKEATKFDSYIKDVKDVFNSNTERCIETKHCLFPDTDNYTTNMLNEFDCSNLGNRKFWEMSENEFETLVDITPKDMEKRINKLLRFLRRNLKKSNSAVCITHGMFIRYLYWYLTGQKDTTAYKVINSLGFEFHNLDILRVSFTDNFKYVANIKVMRFPNKS